MQKDERIDRIHILGASGSGTTTIAKELCERLSCAHFDSDDFLWSAKYTLLRPRSERLERLRGALDATGRWILSGSVIDWGNPVIPLFDLAVFVSVPDGLRMERLGKRERERYGEAVLPDGERHGAYLEFMEWASLYESGDSEVRSRKQQEEWLAGLECPVLEVDNGGEIGCTVETILGFIAGRRPE